MNKQCTKCQETKSEEEFQKKKTGLRYNQCIGCRRALVRDHYHKNKEKYKANNKRQIKKYDDFVRSLKDKPCTDCGLSYPHYVMHFDHLDPSQKYMGVSELKVWHRSISRLLEEIAKCELVCANCHAIRTWNRIPRGIAQPG